MSKKVWRTDTNCQNCNSIVTEKYCGNCGQENTETRKSFHYLITHFLQDLVHYESDFWNAIRYLLLCPEKLSMTYLQGKRNRFMAPVRLFIFINIVSFFIFNSFTFREIEEKLHTEASSSTTSIQINNNSKSLDTNLDEEIKKGDGVEKAFFIKLKNLLKTKTKTEVIELFLKNALVNLPKYLILLMPFFAFGLWLTHNKKKWWYFDHGIFTFHYFSSALLILSISVIISKIVGCFGFEFNDNYNLIVFLLLQIIFLKAFINFYKNTFFKSIFKLVFLYTFNAIIFGITSIFFFIYLAYAL